MEVEQSASQSNKFVTFAENTQNTHERYNSNNQCQYCGECGQPLPGRQVNRRRPKSRESGEGEGDIEVEEGTGTGSQVGSLSQYWTYPVYSPLYFTSSIQQPYYDPSNSTVTGWGWR